MQLTQNILDSCAEINAVSRVLSSKDRLRFFKCFLKNLPRLIKERSFRSIDGCMHEKEKVLEINCMGVKYHLFDYDFSLVREIYARRIYFPDTDWLPKRGDLVFDLGANIGMVTLLCAKRGADVAAVEAQDGFVPCIKENLSKNNCLERVRILHGLIGSKSGVFSNAGKLSTADHYNGNLPNLLSMQDILNIYTDRRVHLLKIDIEGSEFDLFSGNLNWLKKINRIAMEVHPDFGNVQKLFGCIARKGFRCWMCSPTMHRVERIVHRPGLLFCQRIK